MIKFSRAETANENVDDDEFGIVISKKDVSGKKSNPFER